MHGLNNSTVSSSPWKKPKSVLITKTNSIKRKWKSFSIEPDNTSILNENIQANNRKQISNVFSVSSTNEKFKGDDDDMTVFFDSTRSHDNTESIDLNEESLKRTNDYLSSIAKNIVSNVNSPNTTVSTQEKSILFEGKFIPIDWSLKTKLRFCSKYQFKCCNNLKSIHESQGIYNFVKFNEFYHNLNEDNDKNTDDLYRTLLCEALNYWIFPYLPWLKLYSRNTNSNHANSSTLAIEAQQCLIRDWTISFKSLYNSLKCNECPYFYILSNSLMILFRAANINGCTEINAIITPSSRGLRKVLKDEGIAFTVPLINKTSLNYDLSPQKENKNVNNSNETLKNSTKDKCNDEEKNIDEDDETNEWLQKIGFDTSNFKVFNMFRSVSNTENDENIDYKPQSTIFIQGDDVHALFNYLLNSKILISSTGLYSGIPPTLISSRCFAGATLQKIKLQQAVIKTLSNNGEPVTHYSIDLTGPILPYHIHRLCNLFNKTQNRSFDMTSSTLEHSASFNCTLSNHHDAEYTGQHLDQSELESMHEDIIINGKPIAISKISCEDGIFRCS